MKYFLFVLLSLLGVGGFLLSCEKGQNMPRPSRAIQLGVPEIAWLLDDASKARDTTHSDPWDSIRENFNERSKAVPSASGLRALSLFFQGDLPLCDRLNYVLGLPLLDREKMFFRCLAEREVASWRDLVASIEKRLGRCESGNCPDLLLAPFIANPNALYFVRNASGYSVELERKEFDLSPFLFTTKRVRPGQVISLYSL